MRTFSGMQGMIIMRPILGLLIGIVIALVLVAIFVVVYMKMKKHRKDKGKYEVVNLSRSKCS